MDGLSILSMGTVGQINDPAWTIVGVADFDGDGKADILWRNSMTGENYLHFMDGFKIASQGSINIVPDQNWMVIAASDFDGDGKADILWKNPTNGDTYLYLMDGRRIVTAGYVRRMLPNLDWQIVHTGDYDADGKTDILWQNVTTRELFYYDMDGMTIHASGHLGTVSCCQYRTIP